MSRWVIVMGIVILTGMLFTPAHAGDFGRTAPLNPAFEAWRAKVRADRAVCVTAKTRRISGRRPSPVNLSHLFNRSIVPPSRTVQNAAGAFPSRYDLRNTGKVSPVKDQDPWGSCWTFATMGSAESSALGRGWQSPDFSEKHLAWFGYTDVSPALVGFDRVKEKNIYDQGGSATIAVALLSRWTGIVGEGDVPYADFTTPPPADAKNAALLNACRIAPAGVYFQKNVKYLVQNYGAVNIDVYIDGEGEEDEDETLNSSYNPERAAFYYAGESAESNHAVLAVGWDDAYSRENFLIEPPGDGAWIVRNSWGDDWGDEGYFYVSYYDNVTGALEDEDAFAFEVVPPQAYDGCDFHDPLGVTGAYAVGNNDGDQWFSNVFTSDKTQNLHAVGLFAMNPDTTMTIFVYTDIDAFNPRSGALALSPWTVACAIPGYYVLNLEHTVPVMKNQQFSIVVNTRAPDAEFPIAIESPEGEFSSKAKASKGQSFVSADGASWKDLTEEKPNANVCLKVFFTAGLEQVIGALQVMQGMATPSTDGGVINDVDNDGKIGFAEALYTLQVNAGLR